MQASARKIFAAAAAAAVAVAAAAQDSPALWGTNYGLGNLVPVATAALESDGGAMAISLYPQAEYVVWKPSFGEVAPFDLALMAAGRISVPISPGGGFGLGVVAGPALHFGLRGLELPMSPYLDRLDFYTNIGVGANLVGPNGAGFAIHVASGANYFIDERLAVGLGYTNWNGFGGVGITARYRFGASPAVRGMGEAWAEVKKAVDSVYLTRFYAFLGFAFYTGGYWWAPETLAPGQSATWRYSTSEKGSEPFYVERAYLGKEGGLSWWRLKFWDASEEILYEFALDADWRLAELYFADEQGKAVHKTYPAGEEAPVAAAQAAPASDLAGLTKGNKKEDVKVPAGTYKGALVYRVEGDGERHAWWFSADASVPGRLVKFQSEDADGTTTAELFKLEKGQEGAFKLRK